MSAFIRKGVTKSYNLDDIFSFFIDLYQKELLKLFEKQELAERINYHGYLPFLFSPASAELQLQLTFILHFIYKNMSLH